ncbi:MAG: hypothetical protein U9N73_09175, partial [Candidatus Auribacterota bacterium]|nr:hypothetical protein [Candidatus Auribacterota bacterium]
NFILACNAADPNNYKEINDPGIKMELGRSTDLDHLIDRKTMFNKLSSEAKDLVKTIFKCPTEFLNIAGTPKENKICKKGVEKYSKSIHGKKKGIRIFKEVKKFATN